MKHIFILTTIFSFSFPALAKTLFRCGEGDDRLELTIERSTVLMAQTQFGTEWKPEPRQIHPDYSFTYRFTVEEAYDTLDILEVTISPEEKITSVVTYTAGNDSDNYEPTKSKGSVSCVEF